jgi:GDP-4-dehydro-6-deoxy-D-mannose reductase
VSSADVYGRVQPDELPITEGAPFRPVTPYAASKIAADQLGLQAWLGYGLEVLRVRAFNHLGPGQATAFVAPALAERIALNERDGSDVVPVGNLTPRRDITDVRDVVRAYRLLMTHGEPGEAYNVCTGRDLSIGELAEHLVALAAHPMRLEPDPALQRRVETPVLRGDNAKLRRTTGWEPEIPLDQTLADVLAEHRALVGATSA